MAMARMQKQEFSLVLAAFTAIGLAGWALAQVARPSAEQVRATLARILADPAYQQADSPRLQALLARISHWLNRLFQGLWGEGVYELKEAWPGLYWAIVAILLVILGLLGYHIAWTLSAAFRTRVSHPATPTGTASASPEVLRTRAAHLATQGRYQEAIRLLHEALIRLLDLKGLVRFDRSRTNWEYVEAARTMAPLGTAMESLARHLDALLYGGETATEEAYAHCAELVNRAWLLAEQLS